MAKGKKTVWRKIRLFIFVYYVSECDFANVFAPPPETPTSTRSGFVNPHVEKPWVVCPPDKLWDSVEVKQKCGFLLCSSEKVTLKV